MMGDAMVIVTPYTRTTLALDSTWTPFGLFTARATMFHVVKNHGRFLDANLVPHEPSTLHSAHHVWAEDQPVMRSAHLAWPVPVVMVCGHRLWYKGLKRGADGLPPLRDLYTFYRKTCQFCLRPIKLSEASRDHVFPRSRSREVGDRPDDSFGNLVLSCKACNSQAGSAHPKYNVLGEEIVAKPRPPRLHFQIPEDVPLRKEWIELLHLEARPERFGSVRSAPQVAV